MKNKLLALFFMLFISANLGAWGPLTHMLVNSRAYETVKPELKDELCIDQQFKNQFIGLGCSPDIKHTAGKNFSRKLHDDFATILRMIEMAKTDEEFGQKDVVSALGWAGHLYAEVTTAHTAAGYPNTKITATVPESRGLNHQLSEMSTDILVYSENRDWLREISLQLPTRLIEKTTINENHLDPNFPIMTAQMVRESSNKFMPTVLGIRAIAEYLLRERPELIEEMSAFYADREAAIDASVSEVAQMLRNHGKRDFSKNLVASVDDTNPVKFNLGANIKEKFTTGSLDLIAKTIRKEKGSDLLTRLGFLGMKTVFSLSPTREAFIKIASSKLDNPILGKGRNSTIVVRFTEAMLTRYDLTFPEIIAYAQEEFDKNDEIAAKQRQQFISLNLSADGRLKVSFKQVNEALQEVERIEEQRKKWPVFWPWRPSKQKLAYAQEKAGRYLGWYIQDNFANTALRQKSQTLLNHNKTLRKKLFEFRIASWFNPIKKWKLQKQYNQLARQHAQEQQFFVDLLKTVNSANNEDPNQLQRLRHKTLTRLESVKNDLASAMTKLKAIPEADSRRRGKLEEYIARLEDSKERLGRHLAALDKSIANSQAGTPNIATKAPELENLKKNKQLANMNMAALLREYEKTYSKYVVQTQSAQPDTAKVKNLARRLNNIRYYMRHPGKKQANQ